MVLPLGDDGRFGVTGGDVRVTDLVDGGDALLTDRLRVAAELLEALTQQLSTDTDTTARDVTAQQRVTSRHNSA